MPMFASPRRSASHSVLTSASGWAYPFAATLGSAAGVVAAVTFVSPFSRIEKQSFTSPTVNQRTSRSSLSDGPVQTSRVRVHEWKDVSARRVASRSRGPQEARCAGRAERRGAHQPLGLHESVRARPHGRRLSRRYLVCSCRRGWRDAHRRGSSDWRPRGQRVPLCCAARRQQDCRGRYRSLTLPPIGEPYLEPYSRHVLVCTGGFCSPDRKGRALYSLLASLLQRAGLLFGPSRVKRGETPCLGVCAGGPIVVVYPEGVWYSRVTPELLERIVVEHFKEGRIVEEAVFFRLDENGLTPDA